MVRPLGVMAAFAATTAGSAYLAAKTMLVTFFPYDDEGVMLVTLRQFAHAGGLYDHVFSYYGPLYFQVFGSIFHFTPLTHDKGRLVVAIIWTLAPLCLGWAVFRLTSSLAAALVTQLVAFHGLLGLIFEPMHPSGLVTLLMTASVGVMALSDSRYRLRAVLIGVAAAAMLLVKLNVGIFAVAALGLTAAFSQGWIRRRRWLAAPVALVFVALPLILISPLRTDGSELALGLTVAGGALLLVAAAYRWFGTELPEQWLGWAVAGGAALTVLSVAAALVTGTSLRGLIDGWILTPLHQTDFFRIDMSIPTARAYLLTALIVALTLLALARGYRLLGALVRIAVGLGLFVEHFSPDPSAWLLGLFFVWLLVVPTAPEPDGRRLARLYLGAWTLMASLQVYPVAGAQIYWSSLLLLPTGGVLLVDGVRGLQPLAARLQLPAFAGRAAVRAAGVVLVLLAVNFAYVQHALGLVGYQRQPLLNLPGSGRMQLPAEQVATLRAVTAALDRNCTTFVSLPGLNSFYLWARMEPPTGFNDDDWPYLFDSATQQKIVDRVRGIPRLCAIYDRAELVFWQQGRPLPRRALVEYIQTQFRPIMTAGNYTVEVRK